MEDEGQSADSDNTFATELDEKVVLPEHKKDDKQTAETPKEEEPIKLPDKEANPKPSETASPAPKPVPQKLLWGTMQQKNKLKLQKELLRNQA